MVKRLRYWLAHIGHCEETKEAYRYGFGDVSDVWWLLANAELRARRCWQCRLSQRPKLAREEIPIIYVPREIAVMYK